MDFHSLPRHELQALCKQNKIPANKSNVAMADALKALDKVEGLDELINAAKLEPQLSTPRTICRTSTRRKAIVADAESSQPLTRSRRATRTAAKEAVQESKDEAENSQILTRTRRATRKTSAEEGVQENVNENLLETPLLKVRRCRASASKNAESKVIGCVAEKMVDDEKKDLHETPAIQSSKRRGLKVSTRKKTETLKEEKSVQRVYGTRSSVRLLEKRMEGLSLEEIRKFEILKAEGCCKESDRRNVGFGNDMLMVSEDHCNSLGSQKFIQSLNNGRDLKPEIPEDDKTDCNEIDDLEGKQETCSGDCKTLDEKVEMEQLEEDKSIISEVENCKASQDDTFDGYEVDNFKAKLEAGPKECYNLDNILGPESNGSEVLAGESFLQPLDEQVEKKHPSEEDNIMPEVDDCNALQEVGDSDCYEADDLKAKVETESLDCNNLDKLLGLGSDCFEVLEEAGIKHQLEEDMGIESKVDNCNAAGIDFKKCNVLGIVPEIIAEDDKYAFLHELDVIQAELVDDNGPEVFVAAISNIEEDIDGNIGDLLPKYPAKEELNADLLHQVQEELNADPKNVKEQAHLLPECLHYEKSESTGEAESPKRCNEVMDDVASESFTVNELLDWPLLEDVGELSIEYNSEALVDVSIIEDNFEMVWDETPKSVKQATPSCSLVSVCQVAAGTLFDVHVRQAEEGEVAPVPSSLDKTPPGGKVNGNILKSPFPADTLQGQFPRPIESAKTKSSVKKRITMVKMTDALGNNKENVDDSEFKMEEPKEEKMNNEVNLDAMSLRQLAKELKEKLQLANKKKSKEQNGTKVEEKRFALQKLPENCALSDEPRKQN